MYIKNKTLVLIEFYQILKLSVKNPCNPWQKKKISHWWPRKSTDKRTRNK